METKTQIIEIGKVRCNNCGGVLRSKKGFLPRFIYSDSGVVKKDVLVTPRVLKIKCPNCSHKQEVPKLYKASENVRSIIMSLTLFGCGGNEFKELPATNLTFV